MLQTFLKIAEINLVRTTYSGARVKSFELMKKHFHEVEVKFYHLVSLLVVPFRKTFLFKWLLPITDFFDKLLLSNQLIGKYGWIMIIELKKPRKN